MPKAGKQGNYDISRVTTATIDETYFVVGNHLEPQLIEHIQRGEYVDFGKLIPKDRIMIEEDQRLEMIIRNGRTYVPVSDSTTISSFQRWEQAFRVLLISIQELRHTVQLN